jgi:2-keto-4-pentenoate hydratase/2-oxohepta-3-ene-1,7-dioic acid hydratase in catechol pathway
MRLVTFVLKADRGKQPMVGALLDDHSVLGLQAAAALYLKEAEKKKNPYPLASRLIPNDMAAFLGMGRAALTLARRTVKTASPWIKEGEKAPRGLQKETLVFPLKKTILKSPVPRPGKIIAMGLNFRDHAEENKVPIPELPVGFLKASSCVVGPYDPVPYPHDSTAQMDYEIEMAIVIGKKAKNVPKEKAYDHVAGYMIINDLSARDIQHKEMQKRLVLLSKSLDGFGPMGPWLATPDEIPEPHDLKMELRVNQEPEPRQKSSTNQLIYKVPDLVAYWSQMTLEPGDVITSGTPGGVAFFRQPDPQQWFLKPGDVVEARIEKLGALRNKII